MKIKNMFKALYGLFKNGPRDMHVRITPNGQALLNNPQLASLVLDAIQSENSDLLSGKPLELKNNTEKIVISIVGQKGDTDCKE